MEQKNLVEHEDEPQQPVAPATIIDPIDLEEAARYLAAYIREHAVQE